VKVNTPEEVSSLRIIIIGAGEVGSELAAKLARENHDVTVIDKSPAALARLEELDVLTIAGNGAGIEVLEEAGVQSADLVVAVTRVDEINIMACLLAKNSGARRTIARIRHSTYGNEYRSLTSDRLGIDITINPEQVAAQEIVKAVKSAYASEVETFCRGKVQMLGMRLGPQSPLLDVKLKDLELGENILVAAIIRDNQLIIPRGDDSLKLNDHAFFLTLTDQQPDFQRLSGKEARRAEKIMVMGAGKVGRHVVRLLTRSKGSEVKLIDADLEKCREAADLFPEALVLHGSGTDLNFLRQENIESTDVFIAVSGNDEVNILSALLAKKLGAGKTIVEINRPDYAPLVDTLNIDAAIRPRFLTAGAILKLVRKGRIESVMILGEDQGEVIELNVGEKSALAGKTLKDIKLPRGILVGAIVRNDKAIIPGGSDFVHPGDRVVLFCLPELSQHATTLFSG